MLIKAVFAFFAMISLLVVINIEAPNGGRTLEQRQVELQLEDLRIFALSTHLYITNHPEFVGTLTWEGVQNTTALRLAKSTPEATRNYSMSLDWKVVVPNEGDYVFCTPLKAQTIAKVAQRMPASQRGYAMGDHPRFIVFDMADVASQKAQLCQS